MPHFLFQQTPELQRDIFQRLFLSWFCLSLFACATPKVEKDELPDRTFSSIVLISPKDIIEINTPETRSDRVAEGAIAGSAGTGLAATLIGAAACGPYLYGLCVVGMGTAGLLAGGATGALYGFSGLPADVVKKLEQRMVELNQQRDLQSELVNKVTSRVPAAMLAQPDAAEVQAILTIEKIDFSHKKGQALLKTQVRLTFAATESQRKPEFGSRLFYSRSEQEDLDAWLEPDSSALNRALNECLASVAEEIETVLREHWASGQSRGR